MSLRNRQFLRLTFIFVSTCLDDAWRISPFYYHQYISTCDRGLIYTTVMTHHRAIVMVCNAIAPCIMSDIPAHVSGHQKDITLSGYTYQHVDTWDSKYHYQYDTPVSVPIRRISVKPGYHGLTLKYRTDIYTVYHHYSSHFNS